MPACILYLPFMQNSTGQNLVSVAIPGTDALMTYICPRNWTGKSLAGRRVLVPLGKRRVVGVAIGSTINPDAEVRLRYVLDVLDPTDPSVPTSLLQLNRWLSDYYLAELPQALSTALPAGLLEPPRLIVQWIGPELEGEWPVKVQKNRDLLRMARFIAGKQRVSLSQLKKPFKRKPLHSLLDQLVSAGLIEHTDRLQLDLSRAYTDEYVILNDDADSNIPDHAKAQRRLVSLLKASGGELEWSKIRNEVNVQRNVLNTLVERNLVTIENRPRSVIGFGFDPRDIDGDPPRLTNEQQAAADSMTEAVAAGVAKTFLLDGIPGTGKTRVYLEAVKRARELGRGVLVLVPEISLTPQVVARIQRVVDEPVAVLHSNLSATERVGTWRGVRDGQAHVVVGPRSAVFAPVRNLGLIVVDEEHEEAFKQQDPAPRYHGKDVALMRARIEDATVVLTSATPSAEAEYLARSGRIQRFTLSHRFGSEWPRITIADRRRESDKMPYVGAELALAIRQRSEADEGVVLMITRRGFAPVMQCKDCGWTSECPHCDIALTYHAKPTDGTPYVSLRCHLCGYVQHVPSQCAECKSKKLKLIGAGTQRIEQELLERFPMLAPVRMDRDTLRTAGQQERILRSFALGDAQILLGTQLVAKGHDFSHVTLVGVINADPSLYQPDFRAEERTFRLLVQAAGRAGRGGKKGEVIIQTMRPDHNIFTYLKKPSLRAFMDEELERRKLFQYPPFARMVLLTVVGEDDERARLSAERLRERLLSADGTLDLLGPEPAHIARVKRKYRWRILLKTPKDIDPAGRKLHDAVRRALQSVKLEPGVRINTDVDPIEVM